MDITTGEIKELEDKMRLVWAILADMKKLLDKLREKEIQNIVKEME